MEWILLSATGLLGRVALERPYPQERMARSEDRRAAHDLISSWAPCDDAGVAAVTSSGRALLLDTTAIPVVDVSSTFSLEAGVPSARLLDLPDGERVVAVYSLDLSHPALALGTLHGVAKRVVPEYKGWDEWEVIALKEGDVVLGAAPAADTDELVFITSEGQLLRCPARSVRPQGRSAGGMAGVKLGEGAEAIAFAVVEAAHAEEALVVTQAAAPEGSHGPTTIKVSPFSAFPAKGRATGGVRCHRFTKGQDHLDLAWTGLPPARGSDPDGSFRNLPALDERRDGSGTRVGLPMAFFG
ncbi:MAG: hypothetical protein LBM23_10480 [Propionibacteriaceae bacterium]|jgi:DNA gyrase subunit A|nr:hypothetical protein [Propionibacteriaceae bacterium]